MQPSPGLRSALMVIASAPTRWMYADYLTWRGIQVREVASAAAALDHLTAFTPDAAVIEDRLADWSGLDLVRTLRRCRTTAILPIALLSPNVFRLDESRASACGCDLLIMVPCLPEALMTSLVSLVEMRASEPRSAPKYSWLFVNRDASVLIARPSDHALRVAGPGNRRRMFTFSSELDLVAFQVRYERRLVNAGYALEALRTDRRTARRDRRQSRRAQERRASD